VASPIPRARRPIDLPGPVPLPQGDLQLAPDGIVQEDGQVPDVEHARHLAVHGFHELGRVELTGHDARELVERGQLRQVPPVVLQQAGVLEGQCDLVRERLGQLNLVGAQFAPDRVRDDDRPESGAARLQGHGEHRTVLRRLREAPEVRRQGDVGVGQDIGGPHRPADRHRARPRGHPRRQDVTALEGRGARRPGPREDREPTLVIEPPDAGRGCVEELQDRLDHPLGEILDRQELAGQARRCSHRRRFTAAPDDLLLELPHTDAEGEEVVGAERARRLGRHGSLARRRSSAGRA
jgi:hypothetical protein